MNGQRLKDILDVVRAQPDLEPVFDDAGKLVRSYCNIAIDRVMGIMGTPRIVNHVNGQPLLANDMIDCMENSETRFTKVTGDVACARASQGILVIACQCEALRGHVAAVYPAPMEYSGSWKKDVPLLSNVGKKNDVMRASQAFRVEPAYYSTTLRNEDNP
jgi:hypothetical protein